MSFFCSNIVNLQQYSKSELHWQMVTGRCRLNLGSGNNSIQCGGNVPLFTDCPTPPRGISWVGGERGVWRCKNITSIESHRCFLDENPLWAIIEIHTGLISPFQQVFHKKHYTIFNFDMIYASHLGWRTAVLEHGRGNVRERNSFKLFVEDDFFVDLAASQCFDRWIFGL